MATVVNRYPSNPNQLLGSSWGKDTLKFGDDPCRGLGYGTPTKFKTKKSKVLPWQQLLPDTPQNFISSRSSWGKYILKIW